MSIMQEIEDDAGKVASWIKEHLPEAEAIVGEAPTLYSFVEAAITEVESSDSPGEKAIEVLKDIGKAVSTISAALKANATSTDAAESQEPSA